MTINDQIKDEKIRFDWVLLPQPISVRIRRTRVLKIPVLSPTKSIERSYPKFNFQMKKLFRSIFH